MKKTLMLLCLTLTAIINNSAFGQAPALPPEFGPHQWTATVKVVGEDGNPVVGADVAFSYHVPTPPNSDQQTYGEVKGNTDTDGVFSASHMDSSLDLGVVVGKIGYYTTHWSQQFYFDDKNRHPYFTLMLKQIGKPIPMYAKLIDKNPPILNQPVGYDLMVGDWVAPYGNGIDTDITFTKVAYRKSGSDYEYKVTVDFTNAGDGIQAYTIPESEKGSGLQSPHEAPIDGYQTQLIKDRSAHPGEPTKSNYDESAKYFIRVRTVLDSDHNVKSALYGKIYGDFMQFTYYLNPTPKDRNIEFDPKQNLLSLKPGDLKVTAP